MADYKEKLDEWQQTARRKARELDEKFAISDLVGLTERGRRISCCSWKQSGRSF